MEKFILHGWKQYHADSSLSQASISKNVTGNCSTIPYSDIWCHAELERLRWTRVAEAPQQQHINWLYSFTISCSCIIGGTVDAHTYQSFHGLCIFLRNNISTRISEISITADVDYFTKAIIELVKVNAFSFLRINLDSKI